MENSFKQQHEKVNDMFIKKFNLPMEFISNDAITNT